MYASRRKDSDHYSSFFPSSSRVVSADDADVPRLNSAWAADCQLQPVPDKAESGCEVASLPTVSGRMAHGDLLKNREDSVNVWLSGSKESKLKANKKEEVDR